MTIGAIIVDIIILIITIIISIAIYMNSYENGIKYAILNTIIGIIILICIIPIQLWYYNNTESGKRALKTQNSNLSGGITRVVKVYDMNGGLIKEYKGKFDVDYDNDRIIFDDEKGNRHIIYYPTGTIIIDEISR